MPHVCHRPGGSNHEEDVVVPRLADAVETHVLSENNGFIDRCSGQLK